MSLHISITTAVVVIEIEVNLHTDKCMKYIQASLLDRKTFNQAYLTSSLFAQLLSNIAKTRYSKIYPTNYTKTLNTISISKQVNSEGGWPPVQHTSGTRRLPTARVCPPERNRIEKLIVVELLCWFMR